MYNKVILIGNLTKDPELRYTPQGTPVATFRIAVNSKFKQAGELREEALFIDTVVFGKQAETCSQYLNKGKSVLVEGRLQERRFEHEGQQRSKFEIVAQTVRFLSSQRGSGGSQGSSDIESPMHDEAPDLEPF